MIFGGATPNKKQKKSTCDWRVGVVDGSEILSRAFFGAATTYCYANIVFNKFHDAIKCFSAVVLRLCPQWRERGVTTRSKSFRLFSTVQCSEEPRIEGPEIEVSADTLVLLVRRQQSEWAFFIKILNLVLLSCAVVLYNMHSSVGWECCFFRLDPHTEYMDPLSIFFSEGSSGGSLVGICVSATHGTLLRAIIGQTQVELMNKCDLWAVLWCCSLA